MIPLKFDEDLFQVTIAGSSILLLPKEFALFKFLYQNHGQVFSREALLDRIWSLEEPVDRTVDDHIYRLRKKLKDWNTYFAFETVRGKGYLLRIIKPSELTTPSLKDESFQRHFSDLLTKYHLFGQGQALQVLAEQQQILGAKLDPFYEMYTKLLKGNWSILLDPSIPFWDRAYFMVVLYGILEDDSIKGKTMIQKMIDRNRLSLPRQWELQAIDLPFFYLWCGDEQKAADGLAWAYEKAIEHHLDGFKLAILVLQIYPHCKTYSFESAAKKINEADALLHEKPYLRELSYFHLSKGLVLIYHGQVDTGKELIADGIEIIKQAKFELQYLHAVTHVTHCLQQLLGSSDSLVLHYQSLRSDLIKKYNGMELKNKFFLQLNSSL